MEYCPDFWGDFFYPKSFFPEKEFREYFVNNLGFHSMGMLPFSQTLPAGEQIFMVWDPSVLACSGAYIYGSNKGQVELLLYVRPFLEDFTYSLNRDVYVMWRCHVNGEKTKEAELHLKDDQWILRITAESGVWDQDKSRLRYKNKKGSTINLVNAHSDISSKGFEDLSWRHLRDVHIPKQQIP